MNTKLKPCGTCGVQIAKSATKCPHCGKNFSSPAMMILLVIVVGGVLWFAWGQHYFGGLNEMNRQMDEAEAKLRAGH